MMIRLNAFGILLFSCFFTMCLSYQLRYDAVLPAFGTYQDNSRFINPFLFEDESNEQENEDEGNQMFSLDEEPLDEFEPIKRSTIRLPTFPEEFNVKRDLIKGPSFQQNINEENADSDIANENKDIEESNATKRKDISQPNEMDSDDEDIQGKQHPSSELSSSTSTMTTTDDFYGFLNGIQSDLDKVHDQVTRETILLDTPTPTSSSLLETNHTSDSNNDSNHQKLKVTRDLIGLLYNFKTQTENTMKNEMGENLDSKSDFDESESFLSKLKSLKEDEPSLQNPKTETQSKNRKRKIDVTVNVNINDKSIKKSHVAGKPDAIAAKRSRVGNKFLNQHKVYEKEGASDEEEEDDGETDEEEEEPNSKKQSTNTISSHHQNKPKISTVTDAKPHKSIFSSVKDIKKNTKNHQMIADNDEEEDEDEDEDDSGSADNEEEDELSSESHLRLAEKAKQALENMKHKPTKNTSKHSKHHYSDKETAKAEEGETAASNVKANKLAARLEQKQNELEHNDEMAEPITKVRTKAKKIRNKEEEEEVRLTTESSVPSELKDTIGHEAFIHNVKSGNSKAAKAEDVRIEQLSGKGGTAVNSQPNPEVPGTKLMTDKEDETDDETTTMAKKEGTPNPHNTTDMTLEEVREKFKKWEHKNDKTVETAKITESEEKDTPEKSWNEEHKELVEKLKNPLVDASAELKEKVNGGENNDKQQEEEEPSKKEKLIEEEAEDITKSANDAFTKVVNGITTSKDVQELKNHQDKDIKEVSESAEKAFSNVVENVMKDKGSVDHQLKKLESPSIGNIHLEDANLQKLKSFKTQILSEVEKINSLQNQYGKNSKGAKDLIDARAVLEKDLNVVKELEGRLKNRKNKMAEQVVIDHDQRSLGNISDSKEEIISDTKLGFTSESPKSGKKSHRKFHKVKSSIKSNKKGRHPLEEIHSLLKAEIKRLRLKKHGKPDPQLNNIRKLVQKRLKSFIKSGEIGKNEFKALAPEIKELGTLLKHRISAVRKIKNLHKEEDIMKEAKSFGTGSKTSNAMISKEVSKAGNALSNAPRPADFSYAQSALEKLRRSNSSLVSSQSQKMKSLLTSLNSKLGQIFNKANGMRTAGIRQASQQPVQQQQLSYNPSNTQRLQQVTGFEPGSPALNIPNQFSPYAQQPQPNPQAPVHMTGLAKAETPLPDFEPDETKPMADDEPVDTLIEALERDITEVWSYRDMYPDADSLGLDNEKVHNAYANLGSLSGLSLRRALDRALRGEDVGLAVVGGSISKGGPFSEKGLDYVLKSYFYAIEDYWNKIIRPVTGSSLIVRDVSIGGISTDYYSYCLRNHLPDDKLTNIVLWELSANDMKRFDGSQGPKTEPLEQFTRNVISYRAKPALIYVNFFANFDWNPELAGDCRNFEDEGEESIAKYYKITSLSWRNMVCPELQKGTSQIFTRDNLFAEDKFHPSIHGHAQVAYLAIDYIRTEFLKNLVKMRKTNIADAVTRLQIPRTTYVPRPLFPQTANWKPLCYTYMVVDDKVANNTLSLEASPSGSFHQSVVREFKIRSDKIAGMNTLDKDQYVRFNIHLPPHPGGSIQPYKKLGIMSFTDDRKADVQFDAEPTMRIETSKRFLEGTTIKYISTDIRPGNHALSVRSGDNGFLVCAIVVA